MLGSGMMKFFAPSEGEKNLDFFIEEVRRVKSENMMGDTAAMDSSSAAAAAAELVPSFQQVPGHRVEAHSHQDLGALRDMELIVHSRVMAFKNFADTIQQTIKSVGSIDDDYSVGAPTMGNGMNELTLYYEKELHLSIMQEELKQSKLAIEMQRERAGRLYREYGKAIQGVENDLTKSEKKLKKALKERTSAVEEMETLFPQSQSNRQNSGDCGTGDAVPPGGGACCANSASASISTGAGNASSGKGRRRSSGSGPGAKLVSAFQGMTDRIRSSRSFSKDAASTPDGGGGSGGSPVSPKDANNRRKVQEAVEKSEKDVKDCVSELKRVMSDRDDVRAAVNNAQQTLCHQNKTTLKQALGHMISLEERAMEAQQVALTKMKEAHDAMDVDQDEQSFIKVACGDQRGPIPLCQALSMLDELTSTGTAKSAETLLGQYASISLDHLESGDGSHLQGIHKEMNKIFLFADVGEGEDDSQDSAVAALKDAMDTKEGREIIVNALNQYRSRKVNVGDGFVALGQLLWHLLDSAFAANDTRCARVVMMLSQTFHRTALKEGEKATVQEPGADRYEDNVAVEQRKEREYVKTRVCKHKMWHASSCRFWEQALWQLVIEQLPTVRLDKPWFELDMDSKEEVASQIHDVVFSQVMAISHSMKEMHCELANIRSFIYRMTAVHQLSEFQRHLMIAHLNDQTKDQTKDQNRGGGGGGE